MQDKEKLPTYKARLATILLPLIFASIVLFSFFSLSFDIKSRERDLCEGSTVHAASHVSTTINAIVRSGGRMASALQANPLLPPRELSLLASSVLDLGTFVTGVSVAPNAVVKYHFPESGDQSPIGHDLLSNPERRDALARAMETGQPILSGPEESMEGGQSVFIRFPVFEASRIWGFVSVTVDFGSLIDGFAAAGEFPGIAFAVAVRDEDSTPGTWSFAAGTKAAYDARGVYAPVPLPGTEWHIYAMPERGWSSTSPYLYVLFVAGLMAASLLYLTIGRRKVTAANPVRQRPEPVPQSKPSHATVMQHVQEARKIKKEVRFKGQKVKGELYMPDLLLSGDPDSLFHLPEAAPAGESPAPDAQREEPAKETKPEPAATLVSAAPLVLVSAAPSVPASTLVSAAPSVPASTLVSAPAVTQAQASRALPSVSKAKATPIKQEPLFTMEDDPVKATPSILVVDDSEANRDIMGRMLSLRGYSADFAASGEEALTKAESGSYNIVFMDCFMPVMDGYQASTALRSRFPGSAMKIIGISARIGDQEAARCSQAGMDALLAKPFTLKELQATLEKHG